MISLSLSYEIGEIIIVAKDELSQGSLQRLAKIMGLSTQNKEIDSFDVEYCCNNSNFGNQQNINFYVDENNIGIVQHFNKGIICDSFEWMYLIILGVLRKLSNKEKVFLIHCATLEKKDKAILVFGRSGIGKSTTAKRFCIEGGVSRGDDLALCYFCKDKLFVKILPTFSEFRLNENTNKLHYGFEPALEVEKLYLLKRGEGISSVELNDSKEYLAVLTEAMSSHLLIGWKKQTPFVRQICINYIVDLAFEISKKFPAMTIKAHLENFLKADQIFE